MLKKPYKSITALKEEAKALEEEAKQEALRKLQALINYTLVKKNIASKKFINIYSLIISIQEEDLSDEEIINKINATYNFIFSKKNKK